MRKKTNISSHYRSSFLFDRIKVSQVTIIGSNFARLGECSHNFRSSSTFSRVQIPGKISTISFFRVSLFFLITALYTKSKNCRFLLYNAIWGSRSAKREVESCFLVEGAVCVCVASSTKPDTTTEHHQSHTG